MEVAGIVIGIIGVPAAVGALVYAHIAYLSGKEAGKLAGDSKELAVKANDLSTDANSIAVDARDLAHEANAISHRVEGRETERHDVFWEGDWEEPGTYVLVKRGDDEAHRVKATVWVDQEEFTVRADVLAGDGESLTLSFPGMVQELRSEIAERRRSQRAGADSSFPVLRSHYMPPMHSIAERIEWNTKLGAPKLHATNGMFTSYEDFHPN